MQLFRRDRLIHGLIYIGLAISFHVSIAFAFLLLTFSRIQVSRSRSLYIPILGMLISIVLAVVAQGYLGDKVADYTTLQSPGLFSGLSPVGRILIIVFSAGSLPILRADKRWLFTLILTATAFSYGLATFSYAGLRLLEIIASVVPFLFLLPIPPSTSVNRRFRLGLALAGFLGGINTLRGLLASISLPGTPFVPYNFLNETILSRG